VSLTKLHLIPIVQQDGSLNYIPAKDVKVGDILHVMSDDNQVQSSPVTDVIMEMKNGFYAPLTTSGKRAEK
jgi:Hint module